MSCFIFFLVCILYKNIGRRPQPSGPYLSPNGPAGPAARPRARTATTRSPDPSSRSRSSVSLTDSGARIFFFLKPRPNPARARVRFCQSKSSQDSLDSLPLAQVGLPINIPLHLLVRFLRKPRSPVPYSSVPISSGSSGDESDTTRRRELFRVPVAFFLAFFSGTT